MGILVVGSVAFDDVFTPSGKNFNAPGGSATYFSLSASYFTKVKLVAVVGNDFPVKYIRLLESKGIDLKGLTVEKGKTFRWKGRYDCNLNSPQTLATHLNLFKDFKPVLPEEYKRERIVFLANIDPELQLEVLSQVRSPRLTAVDTIDLWIETKRKKLLEVLKKVDICIINEHEARKLAGEANLLKAGRQIISYGSDKVVIKKGENGLLFVSKDRFIACPAYPLENITDPTGAGDTFAGGFLGYLASLRRINEESYKLALAYGTIMASFNVEDFDIRGLAGLKPSSIKKRLKALMGTCTKGTGRSTDFVEI